MYYTYVLRSLKDNKHYIGYTNNLVNRFKEHQMGKVESTKSRRPWMLEYFEAFIKEDLARAQESFYKTGQGRRVLNKKLVIEKDAI